MKNKILFLDIDGVINPFNSHWAMDKPFDAGCIKNLNKVLEKTQCDIVMSSSWRYLFYNDHMSIYGIQLFLQHQGVCPLQLIGVTEKDDKETGKYGDNRGQQILNWLNANNTQAIYAVVDDVDMMITQYKHPFVQTNSSIGLTEQDADKLIELLNKESV